MDTKIKTVDYRPLADSIITLMNANNIGTLAALVIKDGEIKFAEGFGPVSSNNSLQTNAATQFVTSSISKLLVSVAIMQQYEQGKFGLDDDMSDLLGFTLRHPKYPDIKITPRMLMSHRAGMNHPLPNQAPNAFRSLPDQNNMTLFPWIMDIFDQNYPLYDAGIWSDKQPGSEHSNANTGMVLMAYLVEKFSKQNYADYVREHIFIPLGMEKSSYRRSQIDTNNYAPIILPNQSELFNFTYHHFYPAGFAMMSVIEWARFLQMMLNNGTFNNVRILKAETVDLMLTISYPNAGLAFDSGVGLIWRTMGKNHDWIGHTAGGLMTGSTDINRTEKIGIAIFTNKRGELSVTPDPYAGSIYKLIHDYALSH
ncbi:MAG: serine hydrolase [Calditrichaeota bacterium]|nr:serine hydrolase [Calditrichota bacterium]